MRIRIIDVAILTGLVLCASALRAQTPAERGKILVGTGQTYLLDTATDIEKIMIASPDVAEAVAINSRSVVVTGRAPGETSAIVWLADGTRRSYDVSVMFAAGRLNAAKEQLEKEFSGAVQLTGDSTAIYLTGTVKNMIGSVRAESIAGTLGKVVNLLKVEIPPQEQEIMLRVKFANVDRSKSLSLGFNLLGTPGNYPINVTTGASSPSRWTNVTGATPTYSLSDALNILMFDPHSKLLATLQALQGANALQILDEPNLLAMNGREASFLAGGEYPYPTLQGGGGGVGQVTISYREFGIKLKFTPTITPRGTIRLHIQPEVSSLDFADALTVIGGTVPALTTRKVDTEVELEDGQSFAIAGLLDRSTTETLSKIPGLGDIPVLGKLFQSKVINRTNSELIVIVTPELVAPIPRDHAAPDLEYPRTFMQGPDIPTTAPRSPGPDKTGPVAARVVRSEIPVQEMEKLQRDEATQSRNGAPAAAGSTPMVLPGMTPAPAATAPSAPVTNP